MTPPPGPVHLTSMQTVSDVISVSYRQVVVGWKNHGVSPDTITEVLQNADVRILQKSKVLYTEVLGTVLKYSIIWTLRSRMHIHLYRNAIIMPVHYSNPASVKLAHPFRLQNFVACLWGRWTRRWWSWRWWWGSTQRHSSLSWHSGTSSSMRRSSRIHLSHSSFRLVLYHVLVCGYFESLPYCTDEFVSTDMKAIDGVYSTAYEAFRRSEHVM